MVPLRQSLRLLADDLTGALDSAAAFASVAEPVPVRWRGEVPAGGAIAFDSCSREASAEDARASVVAVASALWAPGSGLAFKKIDSLLRGQEAVELAAILALLQPAYCIIAPAFPAQRRITRAGRQCAWSEGGWRSLPVDLARQLAAAGHSVITGRPGAEAPSGISLWDAETDADLDAVVATASGRHDVLWVGSAGLAAALARASGRAPGDQGHGLKPPMLGLIGSEHAVTAGQLDRIGPCHIVLGSGGDAEIARRLARAGVVFATVDVPEGMSRREAADLIETRFAGLLSRLDKPGTLFATGGETLRGVCETLGADRLDVTGEIVPGVPRSILRGGRWDGVAVVSKSGAFGAPDLLQQLSAASVAAIAGAAA